MRATDVRALMDELYFPSGYERVVNLVFHPINLRIFEEQEEQEYYS